MSSLQDTIRTIVDYGSPPVENEQMAKLELVANAANLEDHDDRRMLLTIAYNVGHSQLNHIHSLAEEGLERQVLLRNGELNSDDVESPEQYLRYILQAAERSG